MAYVVNKDCIACTACEYECPTECISMTGPGHTAAVDSDRCIDCGACFNICPTDAINPEE